MKTEILKIERVQNATMTTGEYLGTWSGYQIELLDGEQTWRLKTTTGIRGIAPVKVIVDAAGKIEVIIPGQAS